MTEANDPKKSENRNNTSRSTRRRFLQASGAAGAVALTAGCSGITGGGGSDTLKMGVLEDQSGNFALTGIQKYHAQKLAVEEINEEGGINGQEIEMIAPDPQSDNQRYQELARRLISRDNVDVLFGGFASSSREAIRPIVDENQQLYFYTNQYEGGVADTYTWCTGAVPEQQISTTLEFLTNEFGNDIYTIAADYNFGQITAAWYRKIANEIGANVMNEEFIPLNVSQFGSTINRIQDADPDLLVTLLVGSNHASFYNQKNAAGLDVPMSTTVNMAQGYEHKRFDPPALADMYVGVNYMQEIPTERNRNFVDRFYDRWPDADYVGQMAQNSYFTTYLYKKAVEKAGTTNQDEVQKVLDEEPMTVEAPEGTVTTDPKTHHVTHQIRLARADENHEISFQNQQAVEPYWLRQEPYPGVDLTEVIGTSEQEPTKQFTPQGV
ncbi:urea ABC transporter substrate-binding protein [Haloplanus halobius]|uniref:urea ABC transporter substrate-binding protein n=1 Tax=Haloplanus halobius TaxID=2934938 RepID=UPI003CE57640